MGSSAPQQMNLTTVQREYLLFRDLIGTLVYIATFDQTNFFSGEGKTTVYLIFFMYCFDIGTIETKGGPLPNAKECETWRCCEGVQGRVWSRDLKAVAQIGGSCCRLKV